MLKKTKKCPNKLGSWHSLMRLVKNSNKEISGAFKVPQSHGNYFLGSPAAVFLLKNCADRCQSDANRNNKYKKNYIFGTIEQFLKSFLNP